MEYLEKENFNDINIFSFIKLSNLSKSSAFLSSNLSGDSLS